MALPGIEGFKNVYDILEAVSTGDKFRLRRAARKIRLVLMYADNSTLNEEDRAALVAILGLLVTNWDEAEDLRLEASQEYLHVRAKAGICCDVAVGRVENKIRHYLLDELTDKQKRYMTPGRPLKSIQVRNERQAKENLQQLGLGFRFPMLKMFPDRAFTHPVSKQVLEDRALEQRFNQKFNGFVEVENSDLLDFLFDGYLEALMKHHRMETFNDFDPDLDGPPKSTVSKPSEPTVTPNPKPLSSDEAEKKKSKNKKRNQRKRAAEKIKKKEEAVAPVLEAESKTSTESQVELETSMALVKIDPSSAAQSTEDSTRPKAKFVPKPEGMKWVKHPCLSGEGCTEFFTQLHEAMLRVPTANLEKRVFGSQG